MPTEMRESIQQIVDRYKTLTIIIKTDRDTLNYETEVYNRGVKLITGKDSLYLMSLMRAFNGVIKLIDSHSVVRLSELTGEEIDKVAKVIKECKKNDVDIFLPHNLNKLIN